VLLGRDDVPLPDFVGNLNEIIAFTETLDKLHPTHVDFLSRIHDLSDKLRIRDRSVFVALFVGEFLSSITCHT
jgi:Asp-tRNA(Asn)/Glu-tRNA(Gln) amidotransferase C subunit